jgi:hypothetical protein
MKEQPKKEPVDVKEPEKKPAPVDKTGWYKTDSDD